jgi:hypothetical protein
MTNPFLGSGPHPHPFWNEQAQACEEARTALVKHPVFGAFICAGGKIDVVMGDSYVALLKDGDSVIRGLSFWYTPGYSEPLLIQQESQQAVAQLTAWLTETRDGEMQPDMCHVCNGVGVRCEGGIPDVLCGACNGSGESLT